MNKEEFINECAKINVIITEEIYDKLLTYSRLLIKWNTKFNLTRITEERQIFLKHFYDSLCLNKAIDLKKINTLCDIGSGAGFPGLVLKIVFDNLSVTLIESSNKKCSFLKAVINELNLKNINVVNERAEIVARNLKEKFDIVTCRAVSHLFIISEICVPMVKLNGKFLPLKSNIDEEIKISEKHIKNLNATIEKIIEFELPFENSKRTIPIIIKKEKTNFIYPRDYNKIIKTLEKE